MKRSVLYVLLFAALLVAISLKSENSYAQDALESGFRNPPETAKPRTWWHWTNSNVTKEGITKDLEWMKRSGIGGMMLADVASGSGQSVEKKTLFRSPEWLEAVHHAASEAERLGLEMTIFSSAGWSLTGGPWVKPEQAMKKLVWSEVKLKGPLNYSGKLPMPPSNEGPIQNLARGSRIPENEQPFYRDCIVLAFPTPSDEADIDPVIRSVETGKGVIDPKNLIDDDLNSSSIIKSGKDKKLVWIQYNYDKPVAMRALTLANRAGIPVGTLKAGNDPDDLKTIAILPGAQLYRAGKVETISFPETLARIFRLEFTAAPMKPGEVMTETETKPDSLYAFGEIRLHHEARINRWEDKAGYYHLFSYEPVASHEVSASSVVDKQSVIDVSSFMQPDGSLSWKVPAGNWTIIRFGYSLTGARNRPSVPAGSGLETDKLSREHITAYIKEYTAPLVKELGPLYGKSLRGVMLDSWEAGMQNWTDKMFEEFRNRRGYDLTPFLPCLTGRVVGTSEISDRVLWDFRRTLADMFAENHYAVITEFLNKQGIKTYGEASGVSLEILEDALLCKKYVDYPMGEFWYRALHPELMYYQDIRGAASASHVYDKKIVASESFTGGGFESPYTLKKIGDYWFSQGVNRFVFHTSAHQPLDTKPGNTMVGTHINRNITWAEQAGPFMTYLSRNSFMLQQGFFVADLAYLLDEGAPSTMPIWGTGLNPGPPEGYDYDYINSDVLVNLMSVSAEGRLVLPGGMSYAMLVLPNTDKMTLPVLKKLNMLVQAGATIIGQRPEHTPGYTNYPGSEDELKSIAASLWSDLDGVSRTRRAYGKGKVIWGMPVRNALEFYGFSPDFEYGRPLGSKLNWIHRRTADEDIYFIVNSTDNTFSSEISCRVSGMKAEKWDPATGEIKGINSAASGKRTVVPLQLNERESCFIVFRNGKDAAGQVVSYGKPDMESAVTGPWEISFPSGMGAPEKIMMDTLKSWTLSREDGVKYFSGTATYTTLYKAESKLLLNAGKLFLDLGNVGDLAEVSVNGIPAGTVWKAPWQADITGMLKKGANTIAIKVTNEWTNRIAGDRASAKKVLNSPLFVRPGYFPESGLLEPVTIKKYNQQSTLK
jgi:hypothetical protein